MHQVDGVVVEVKPCIRLRGPKMQGGCFNRECKLTEIWMRRVGNKPYFRQSA